MKYDLPQTTPFRTNCDRYQELIKKNGRTPSEDIELAALATTLADYMIKANDWNTLEVNVNNHLANVSNPHNVTTTQIGAETPTGAQAKVNAHVAASDPHPQYATDTDLSAHAGLTNPHNATSSATANRLSIRDGNGRSQFADPVAAQDAATKNYVDNYLPYAVGSYTGNGAATRDIALPFTPSAVQVFVSQGTNGDHLLAVNTTSLAVVGSPVLYEGAAVLSVGTNKFTISSASLGHNFTNKKYNYIAYR